MIDRGSTHVPTSIRFLILLATLVLETAPCGVAFGAATPDSARDDPPEADAGSATSEAEAEEQKNEKKGGVWSRFKDPEDGMLDIMAGDEEQAGIFPLVVPFNDPTVGVGLVMGVAFFHPPKGEAPPASRPGAVAPPTATFGAGAVTSNGTWFAAAGHHHVWKQDRIRYLGAVGGGSINMTFYGFDDDDGGGEDDGQDFNIVVAGLIQEVKFRIGESPMFAGVRYVFAATDTTFEAGVGPDEGRTTVAGISGLFEYDTRDTVFTPTRGFVASLELSWFAEALGGDFDYGAAKTRFRYYWPLFERWVLGFRADYDYVGTGAPFYMLSFVRLRGVPILRYLGNNVATVEIEPRYRIGNRWNVLAFTGTGRAARTFTGLQDAEKVHNFGAGFRYLIAKKLGLGAGIDVARGPEETVPYVVLGGAW